MLKYAGARLFGDMIEYESIVDRPGSTCGRSRDRLAADSKQFVSRVIRHDKHIHYQLLFNGTGKPDHFRANSPPEIAKCLASISHRLQFYFLNPPPVEFLAVGAVNDVFQGRVGYFLIGWLREPASATEDQPIILPF